MSDFAAWWPKIHLQTLWVSTDWPTRRCGITKHGCMSASPNLQNMYHDVQASTVTVVTPHPDQHTSVCVGSHTAASSLSLVAPKTVKTHTHGPWEVPALQNNYEQNLPLTYSYQHKLFNTLTLPQKTPLLANYWLSSFDVQTRCNSYWLVERHLVMGKWQQWTTSYFQSFYFTLCDQV